MFKPFKPPLLKKVEKQVSVDLTEPNSEEEVEVRRPYKKRRLLVIEDIPPKKKLPFASSAVSAPRKPLLVVNNPNDVKPSESAASDCPEGYYVVLWYANLRMFVVNN
jgi:DNA repair and recombination protein RAD54B